MRQMAFGLGVVGALDLFVLGWAVWMGRGKGKLWPCARLWRLRPCYLPCGGASTR